MEAAANQPSAPKITLGNILGVEGKDVYNPPYDKASFEKYLIEEHTSENIEFWNAAQSYKKYATRYYPPLIHRTFHSSFVQLKNALSKGKLQENRLTSRISPKTSKSASEGGLSGSKNALSPSAQEGGRTGERRSLNASEGRLLGSPSALSLSAQEGGVTAERQSLSTTPSVSEGRLSPSADKVAKDGGNKIKAKGEGEASVETDEGNKELTDEVMAKLKDSMGEIIKSFLTPGSEKEINVNDNVRKKATARYEQGDYSPEVLRPAADKAFEMMKVQSLGRYLAHCQTKGAVPRKASLVAGPDRSTAKTTKDKEKCIVS